MKIYLIKKMNLKLTILSLSRWADLVLVVPATANLISKRAKEKQMI